MKDYRVSDFMKKECLEFLRQARKSGVKISEIDYGDEVFEIKDPRVWLDLHSGSKPIIAAKQEFFEAIKIDGNGVPEEYRLDKSEPFKVLALNGKDGIVGIEAIMEAKPGDYLLVKVASLKKFWQQENLGEIDGQIMTKIKIVNEEVLKRWYVKAPVDLSAFEGMDESFLAEREFYVSEQRAFLAYQVSDCAIITAGPGIAMSFLISGSNVETEAVVAPKYSTIVIDPYQPGVAVVMTQAEFDSAYKVMHYDDQLNLFPPSESTRKEGRECESDAGCCFDSRLTLS